MNNTLLFVANWKMYFTLEQSTYFATEYFDSFVSLAQESGHTIVLCPSFISLPILCKIYENTPLKFGAQDCCDHQKGAFTGQTTVQDLVLSGCSYCIVGHSERRIYNGESNELIGNKCRQVAVSGLSPIVCIGESKEEYEANLTINVLDQQLQEILSDNGVDKEIPPNTRVCIAYEPLWAIGTGTAASIDHLETIFVWLHQRTQALNHSLQWKLLYGGSVNSYNVKLLAKIEHLEGFLIGGASLDFQEFEKIVNYQKYQK